MHTSGYAGSQLRGGIGVAVGITGVGEGGTDVAVGGKAVAVCGTDVGVGGKAAAVGGTDAEVGRAAVGITVAPTPAVAALVAAIAAVGDFPAGSFGVTVAASLPSPQAPEPRIAQPTKIASSTLRPYETFTMLLPWSRTWRLALKGCGSCE